MARRKNDSKITVDTRELQKLIGQVNIRKRNFRPVWASAMKDLEQAHQRLFQTAGAPVGGWQPLEANSFYSKRSRGYGNEGILIRTGTLEDSLSSARHSEGVRDMGPTSMEFGTKVEYAKFHQTGTRYMHEREVVYVPRTFASDTGNKAASWLIAGRAGIARASGENAWTTR